MLAPNPVVTPTTRFSGFPLGHTSDPNYQRRAVLAGLLPRHKALSLLALRPIRKGGGQPLLSIPNPKDPGSKGEKLNK
jgi:hypothetical protein